MTLYDPRRPLVDLYPWNFNTPHIRIRESLAKIKSIGQKVEA
jgi:hypothetical protein